MISCQHCGKPYKSETWLQKHIQAKHSNESSQNNVTSSNRSNNNINNVTNSNNNINNTLILSDINNTQRNINQTQILNDTINNISSISHSSNSNAKFECKICKKQYVYKKALQNHIEKMHQSENLTQNSINTSTTNSRQQKQQSIVNDQIQNQPLNSTYFQQESQVQNISVTQILQQQQQQSQQQQQNYYQQDSEEQKQSEQALINNPYSDKYEESKQQYDVKLQCIQCIRSFDKRLDLENHLMKDHSYNFQNAKIKAEEICQKAEQDSILKKSKSVQKNQKKQNAKICEDENQQNQYQCFLCENIFKLRTIAKNHIHTVHQNEQLNDTDACLQLMQDTWQENNNQKQQQQQKQQSSSYSSYQQQQQLSNYQQQQQQQQNQVQQNQNLQFDFSIITDDPESDNINFNQYGDDNFLIIDEEFTETQTSQSVNDVQLDNFIFKGLQLDEDVYNPFKQKNQQQLQQITQIQPPNQFRASLYEYQLMGLQFMQWRECQVPQNSRLNNYFVQHFSQSNLSLSQNYDQVKGGILADSMGLGKTIQLIATMITNQIPNSQKGTILNNLIVLPKSLMAQWEQEIATHTNNTLNVVQFAGTGRESLDLMKADVVLITYDTLRSEFTKKQVSKMYKYKWHRIILDEAQKIANPSSQTSKACRNLEGNYKWISTGTPLQNELLNIYPLLNFLGVPGYEDQKQFNQVFRPISTKPKKYSPEQYSLLQQIMLPLTLRRTKQSKNSFNKTIIELPQKRDIQVLLQMQEEELEIYKTVELNSKQEVEEVMRKARNGEQFDKREQMGCILGLIMQLRRLCDYPTLLSADNRQKYFEIIEKVDNLNRINYRTQKMQKCLEIAQTTVQKNNKIVIFVQFLEVIDILQSLFKENIQGQENPLILQGKQTITERQKVMQDFKDPYKNHNILICSLKVAEVGLNLVSANVVVLYDNWFNPTTEEQAIDRVHRIGQQKEVLVYRLHYKNTIEEFIETIKTQKEKMIHKQLNQSQISSTLSQGTTQNNTNFQQQMLQFFQQI